MMHEAKLALKWQHYMLLLRVCALNKWLLDGRKFVAQLEADNLAVLSDKYCCSIQHTLCSMQHIICRLATCNIHDATGSLSD